MAVTNLPPADYNSDLRRAQRNTANDPNASVAVYSDQQSAALPFLIPTSYCSRPELFLEEAAATYIPKNCYESDTAYTIRLSSALSPALSCSLSDRACCVLMRQGWLAGQLDAVWLFLDRAHSMHFWCLMEVFQYRYSLGPNPFQEEEGRAHGMPKTDVC